VEQNNEHIDHISAKSMEAYVHGSLNSRDMHLLEKHLLSCDLCSEALEGYELYPDINIKNVSTQLQTKLDERTAEKSLILKMAIAASITLLLSLSILLIYQGINTENSEMALSIDDNDKMEILAMDSVSNDLVTDVEKYITDSGLVEEGEAKEVIKIVEIPKVKEAKVATNKNTRKRASVDNKEKDETLIALNDKKIQKEVVEAIENEKIKLEDQENLESTEESVVIEGVVIQEKSMARTSFSSSNPNQNRVGQERLLVASNNSSNFIDPVPSIGFDLYNTYLADSLQYPQVALKNNIEGVVVLELIISEKGKLVHIKIIKGLGYGCDEEAQRLVLNGVSWIAGIKNGNAQSMTTQVSVPFIIQ
jgi:TonB family protein